MKKPTRRRPSGNVIPMTPNKGHDEHQEKPPGTVLVDRVYDRGLGRFEDEPDEMEDNFYLDQEEDAAAAADGDRPDAVTAIVAATFEAATTPEQRRRLRHNQSMCAIIHVPSPAWVLPVSVYFRSEFGERWQQHTRHVALPNEKNFSTSSAAVSLALSAGQSVAGIAADVGLLPRSLIGAADVTIRLPSPNAAILRIAIGRFAKRAPAEIGDTVTAGLDLPDLVAAFRPGAGPARIVQRLAAAAAALQVYAELREAPPCSS
ncbi:hypothetical protein [Bradyrhizobium guangzhouense]|uniref:Uncharacterized protein n=1 Tax=Bradyrhizobium guangzhouense TaxID=1325095 RepID=A0AAE5X582_9BRAD|nr:hypothetical protein [Bradyrhizobium guangzhouense]QAU48845.1 hypothetical protein XH91_28145 [Bradyrhizobium guangzhouense]